jgi:D-aminopeptidase
LKPGKRNLITDVPGLKVGNASDAALKSGTTVLIGDKPFTASAHVMGGAPGTRETDLLAPDKLVEQVDALVLSGGSAFGLDAASGVTDGLRALGRGFVVGPATIPIVPTAILFDLLNGGAKDWASNPYPALGRSALENAATDFKIGTQGAGTGATTASTKGGLGSASFVLDNGITVGALVAANPLGSVTTPDSKHFWAAPFECEGEFGGLGPDPRGDLTAEAMRLKNLDPGQNTTIAIVATDAALSKTQCHRIATAAHDGMARAIVPSHTPFDGDIVFAAATGTNTAEIGPETLLAIGHAAAQTLARAIARAIHAATPQSGDLLPSWSEL